MNKIIFFLLILSCGLSIPTSIQPRDSRSSHDYDSSSQESPLEHRQRRHDSFPPHSRERSQWQISQDTDSRRQRQHQERSQHHRERSYRDSSSQHRPQQHERSQWQGSQDPLPRRQRHRQEKSRPVLAATIKDELGKAANKAINVDNGVYEKKHYRNYELLKKRRKKLAKKLDKKEMTPIKYMKSIGRSVLHHDPKLAAMVEENLENRAEVTDDEADHDEPENDSVERSLQESPLHRETIQRRQQTSRVRPQQSQSRQETRLQQQTQRQETSRNRRQQESSRQLSPVQESQWRHHREPLQRRSLNKQRVSSQQSQSHQETLLQDSLTHNNSSGDFCTEAIEDAIRQEMANNSYNADDSHIEGDEEERLQRFQESQRSRLNLDPTNSEGRFSFQFCPAPRLPNEKAVNGSMLREARRQHSTEKSNSESSESDDEIIQPNTRVGRRSIMRITSDNDEETQSSDNDEGNQALERSNHFSFNGSASANGMDKLSSNNVTENVNPSPPPQPELTDPYDNDDIFDQINEMSEIPRENEK